MIRIRQIKILVSNDNEQVLKLKVAKKLKIDGATIKNLTINKKSIDARDKKQIFYVYEVDVEVLNEDQVLATIKDQDIFKVIKEEYQLPAKGNQKLNNQIIVVGSGPAGLFASFLLAETGYKPLIIERGKPVEERVEEVNKFWQTGKLNPECNVQFGEGGAGTFSDGKLNTLVKDKRHLSQKVFDIFVENGAPEEIKYLHNPHIGTDNLRKVIKNMREKIKAMGASFLYDTKLTNLIIEDNKLKQIEVNNSTKINCDCLVLAIGHSARDTISMLYKQNIAIEAKPFAMGIRIMHPQKVIDENQYGKFAQYLPPASYKLTYTTKDNRGVYSFCMCPGGYVVNASSEKNRLAINGMSNYKRDSQVANSAIIVTVTPQDFGKHPLAGIKYQQELEEKAFNLANGQIPLQLWQDFKQNKASLNYESFAPQCMGNYTFTNIRNILPDFMVNSLLEAIPYFANKISNFSASDTILAAIESRTSSPVRILRNENLEANIEGIYPCGEGAGYAGGITTSAIDGIKVAEEIIKKYY